MDVSGSVAILAVGARQCRAPTQSWESDEQSQCIFRFAKKVLRDRMATAAQKSQQ